MTERNERRRDGDFNPQGNSLRISSDLIGKTLPVTFNTPEENNAEGNLKCGLYFQGGFGGSEELMYSVYILGWHSERLFPLVLWALFCAVMFLVVYLKLGK